VPSVVFSAAPRAELIEARDWYAARNAELIGRFIAEVENLVVRIAAVPRRFPVVHRDVRCARCRRFPHALFFFGSRSTPRMIACFYAKRDPRQWQWRS
jgi:plasmid stabilization system protein ParE